MGWPELAVAARAVQAAASGLKGVSRPGLPCPGQERGPLVIAVDNTPECVATLLGAAIAGVDVILIESDSSVASELSFFGSARPRVLVGPAGSSGSASIRHHAYRELIAAGRERASDESEFRPASSIVHQVTSGSTGEPRIARV